MEVNKIAIRTWSMLGQRGTFGTVLASLAENRPEVVALSADLCQTSGLGRFASLYPDRFFNTGIAEQNMIGVAAGLAESGFVPFATTFANFAALRSCEMMRHFLGYMQSNVKVVGLSAGYGMEFFGNTHYGIEDLAALRAIPGLVILSPADGVETYKCVEAAISINSPVYLRLTGVMNNPLVYKEDYEFSVGKAVELKSGDDVAIIATGSMVEKSLKAAQLLADRGVECTVLNMHTIAPLDINKVTDCFSKKLIVSVEEHSCVGGLGGAIAEFMSSQKNAPKLLRLGVPQGYMKAGSYNYMLEQAGLTAPQIADVIEKEYKESKG